MFFLFSGTNSRAARELYGLRASEGKCHEIFNQKLYRLTNPSGPLIEMLKHFAQGFNSPEIFVSKVLIFFSMVSLTPWSFKIEPRITNY